MARGETILAFGLGMILSLTIMSVLKLQKISGSKLLLYLVLKTFFFILVVFLFKKVIIENLKFFLIGMVSGSFISVFIFISFFKNKIKKRKE